MLYLTGRESPSRPPHPDPCSLSYRTRASYAGEAYCSKLPRLCVQPHRGRRCFPHHPSPVPTSRGRRWVSPSPPQAAVEAHRTCSVKGRIERAVDRQYDTEDGSRGKRSDWSISTTQRTGAGDTGRTGQLCGGQRLGTREVFKVSEG